MFSLHEQLSPWACIQHIQSTVQYFIAFDLIFSEEVCSRWGYSSVAEHSTADREVPGSIPLPSSFVFEKHILLVMSYLDLFFNIWIECVHDNSIVRQQKQSFGDIGIRTRGLSHAKRALYHWAISPLHIKKCKISFEWLVQDVVFETVW